MDDCTLSVGLLLLPSTKVDGAGSMLDAEIMPGQLTTLRVPAESLAEILTGAAEPHYVAAAEELVASGNRLIASNCGLTARYQQVVQAATGKPTMMSSLLLVPLMLTIFGGPVGVVGFETNDLRGQLELIHPQLDVQRDCRLVPIKGLPGLEWLGSEEILPPQFEQAAESVSELIRDLVREHSTPVVIMECTGILPIIDKVRDAAGVPVIGMPDFLRYLASQL